MSAARLRLFIGICLITRVTAGAGDDFSNNLFSDLAPLLALFGERVTMQFMSQSMGWADNITLAMAPLGIITAVVGAIRVGGPSWLKAIIGRARESHAVAEAELMSSTSNEVCELWNGQQIVRVMGKGPICEFIILLPEEEQAGESSYGKQPRRDQQIPERSVFVVRNGADTTDTAAKAPNLTLNVHDSLGRGELYVVAVFGVILQLGVLVYSGFATYHSAFNSSKDVNPVAGYAYPCTAVGTLLLVTGVLLCSHVVENSTEEATYFPKPARKAHLVWLQRSGTVNDQAFGSFAIFPQHAQVLVKTSQRASTRGISHRGGTRESICGYIVQFTGLRGMHWSASVAQLGATILMTILRAWVRRNLAGRPRALPIVSGHELDWLAMTF
ncbi:hypothetical protein P885DRAFT_33150, partial [Corynascus similis CBS 632.67]